MSSMMEFMEKITPLNKKYDRKKGLTLVEIMAAMAILSILFVGISTMMINTAKTEDKSNVLLNNTAIIRAIFTSFEVNTDGSRTIDYINNTRFYNLKEKVNITLRFNTIENMQQQLKDDLIISDGSNYIAEITIRDDGDNIYNIKINLINNIKNEDITKEMYVYRKI